jgi:shikimate dehydrogenase
MYPHTEKLPDLPYYSLTKNHVLYDLIYNPAETLFMQQGKKRGCKTVNGLFMLHQQAEAAWSIWNSK